MSTVRVLELDQDPVRVAVADVLRRVGEVTGGLKRTSPGWWSTTAMQRTRHAACAKVGVSGVSLYEGLKHSTATHLKALGADDRVLAALAGHRDPRSLAKYERRSPVAVATALRRLREQK